MGVTVAILTLFFDYVEVRKRYRVGNKYKKNRLR